MMRLKVEAKEMMYACTAYCVKKEIEFNIDEKDVDTFFKLIDIFKMIKTQSLPTVATCPHVRPEFQHDVIKCTQHGEIWICIR